MIFDILLLIVGGVLLIYAFSYSRVQHGMENTPTSKIRSVAMGFAELRGIAEPRIMLKSPYTETPCLYYRCTTSIGSESGTSFYLNDGTGKILVNPKHAQMNLAHSFITNNSSAPITEWCIMAGEPLYIAGTVGKAGDFVSAAPDQRAHYLRELENSRAALENIDLQPAEWTGEEARERARERFRKDIKALEEKLRLLDCEPAGDMTEEITIGKGDAGNTFIISSAEEKDLTAALSDASSLYFAASIIMVLVATVSLLSRSGVLQVIRPIPWEAMFYR